MKQIAYGVHWFRGSPVGLPSTLHRSRVFRLCEYDNLTWHCVRLASPARHQRYFGAWYRGGYYRGNRYIRYCFGPSETLSETAFRCARKEGGVSR